VVADTPRDRKGKTEWALLSFGGCKVSLLSGFTMDPARLAAATDALTVSGDTPLTYGMYKALAFIAKAAQGHDRRLVIINDGRNQCPEHKPMRQPESASPLQTLMDAVKTSTAPPTAAVPYVEASAENAPRDLSQPAESVQQAFAEAQQALANGTFVLSVRTIGFTIKPTSDAEKYLQEVAQIGMGVYVGADTGAELPAATSKAAHWRVRMPPFPPPAIAIYSPEEGAALDSPFDVEGATNPPNGLVFISVVPVRADTGEKLRAIPVIRHRSDSKTGAFSFPTPLPRAGDYPLRYEVHADLIDDVGEHGVIASAVVGAIRKRR
jgi:hypothetical protein